MWEPGDVAVETRRSTGAAAIMRSESTTSPDQAPPAQRVVTSRRPRP